MPGTAKSPSGYHSRKRKWLLAPSCLSPSAPCARASGTISSLLCRLPLLYTLTSPTLTLLANFPFPLQLSPLPFSSQLFRTCPFKTKPTEDPETKPFISSILRAKAELGAIVTDFSQSNWSASQTCWGIEYWYSTYQPAFSDLYQLVHMLVGKGQPQHWIKTANWENPKRYREIQLEKHYRTRFLCPTRSKPPNAETPMFVAAKGFTHNAAKREDRRTSLKSTSSTARELGVFMG